MTDMIMLPWSPERTELMVKLYLEGWSASQIAKTLGGITRNAVIGKIHRMGLQGKGRAEAAAPRLHKPRSELAPPKIVSPPPPRRLAPPKTEAPVAMPSLHQCKWPIGDPAEPGFAFCQERAILTDDGSPRPYCAAHCREAYQPLPPSSKRKPSWNDLKYA